MNTILGKMYPPSETVNITNAMDYSKLEEINARKNKIRLVSGHMFFGVHKYVRPPYRYITMLRDPVERVISFFYYQKRSETSYLHSVINERKMDLDDFLDSPISGECVNQQTLLLAGIDGKAPDEDCPDKLLEMAKENLRREFSIGITEEFDLSLKLFQRNLGWPSIPGGKTENVGANKPKIIPESTIDKIEKMNQMDIKLYRLARELFYDRISELGISK